VEEVVEERPESKPALAYEVRGPRRGYV
jgi:hypothetical protein